jgi:plastocyanin
VRGHPLDRRLRTALGSTAIAVATAGCGVAGEATPNPSSAVEVTIATAAGDRLAFEPAEVSVPSAGMLTITFHNGSSVAHNLVFTSGISVSTGSIVEPGTIERLSVAPLRPGRYRFVCTIHEGMAGSLVVDGPSAVR